MVEFLEYPSLSPEDEAIIDKSKGREQERILSPLELLNAERKGKKESREFKEKTSRLSKIKMGLASLSKSFKSPKIKTKILRKTFSFPKQQKPKRRVSQQRYLARLRGQPQFQQLSNYDKQQVLENYYQRQRQEKINYQDFQGKLSPSTQAILDRLRWTQNKGFRDNEKMQRVLRERKLISSAGNLLKAHENMTKINLNFTGVPQDNILLAPNIFREDPINNPHILKSNRWNILQTKEAGNSLFF